MAEIACAFTGHRPKSFPWGYDESASNCVLLKKVLAVQISSLAEGGVIDFLSGMAQGVGLLFVQIVLDLKKKNPALKLHAILPCEGQESKWTASAQALYRSILEQADDVFFVGRIYRPDCMLERYAQKLGREAIIIDPVSRHITHKSLT